MKNLIASAIAAVIWCGAGVPAYAADLGGSSTSVGSLGPSGTTFTGLYGGLTGGWETHNIAVEIDDESIDGIGADGFSGGLTTGYDIASASGKWRFGPWLDAGVSNVKMTAFGDDVVEQDYYAAAGVRAGFVYGSSLIYARGGYQLSTWSSDLIDDGVDLQHWVAGVGIESQASDHLAIRVSADWLELNDASVGGENITDYVGDTDGMRAQIGIVYRP